MDKNVNEWITWWMHKRIYEKRKNDEKDKHKSIFNIYINKSDR